MLHSAERDHGMLAGHAFLESENNSFSFFVQNLLIAEYNFYII
jgi:hypothetical protein